MSNQLSMDTVQAIHPLHAQDWSQRKIARELGIHRSTVAAHLASKPTKVPTGSEDASTPAEPFSEPCPPTGSKAPLSEGADDFPEPFGEESSNEEEDHSRSRCVPWREVILEKLAQGLSAQRIFQDLSNDHDFSHGYDSVKRFVRHLRSSKELPFRRLECEPGAEAQVDFGQAAAVVNEQGRRRRPHLLRVVLSHSRKGYTEAIDKQTTENFLRCLESAFWHFGGVPKTLIIDNLRAAVSKADWFDPELNTGGPRSPDEATYFCDTHTRNSFFTTDTEKNSPSEFAHGRMRAILRFHEGIYILFLGGSQSLLCGVFRPDSG